MITQYSKDMERVIKALNLCRNLHEDQVDKCGQPYWIHPFTVAMSAFQGHQPSQISNMIVGLLHDVPEDTGMAVEALAQLIELTDEEQDALKLLTHDKSMSYDEYINSIAESGNEIAITVKIWDLVHNMKSSRLLDAGLKITEDFHKRFDKYNNAVKKLIAKLNEDDENASN